MEESLEYISPSFTRVLDVPLPSQHRASIDPSTSTLAFPTGDNRVFIQPLHSPHALHTPLVHTYPIRSVSIQGSIVASTAADGAEWQVDRSSKPIVHRLEQYPFASYCHLSQSGGVLLISFVRHERGATTAKSALQVIDVRNKRTVSMWLVEDAFVNFVALSGDAHFAFAIENNSAIRRDGRDVVKVYNAQNGAQQAALRVKIDRNGSHATCVASDYTADNVVVADDASLRLWNVNQPGMPLHNLLGYMPARWKVGAVSQNGCRVAASVQNDCVGIWDTKRRIRLATLVGHQGTPYACAMSGDGRSIFTVGEDGKARKWIMSGALERALGLALADCRVVDEAFLQKYIREENIMTATDLFAGHNLVLLAIRAGVITRDNMQTSSGWRWYLGVNLYIPATKLTMENDAVIDTVFEHAHNIGVTEGLALKAVRDTRVDVEMDMKGMLLTIEALAERVGVLERNIQTLHSEQLRVWEEQQALQDAVQSLSGSLSQLRNVLRKQERRDKYASLGRCMLSFVPFFGHALGEAAFSVSHLFIELKAKDLIEVGTDASKKMVDRAARVDISNFQIAQFAFSREALDKLEEPARNGIITAIDASGFNSPEELQEELRDFIVETRESEPSLSFLDMGSSSWLSPNVPAQSVQPPPSRLQMLDEKAAKYFQYVTHAHERQQLSIEEAKVELNRFLTNEGLSVVDGEQLEDLFFSLADDCAEEVRQNIFVLILREVCKEQLTRVCSDRFKQRARPKNSLSLRMAARIVCNLYREYVDAGYVGERASMEFSSVLQELKRFDIDDSDSIEEKEFLAAIKALLHEK